MKVLRSTRLESRVESWARRRQLCVGKSKTQLLENERRRYFEGVDGFQADSLLHGRYTRIRAEIVRNSARARLCIQDRGRAMKYENNIREQQKSI